MVVGVLNLRQPVEERASGLMVSAFAWEVLDLDSNVSSAGRSQILDKCCSNLSIFSKAATAPSWFCAWKALLVFKIL